MRIDPRGRVGKPGRKRRGAFAAELLFVFPILLAVLMATFEFSMILAARQMMSGASREGARVSALGGTADEAEAAARRFLGTGSLAAADVIVNDTDGSGNPAQPGDPVSVIVRIPTPQVVPDLLAIIGFSIRGDVLVAETVMRKE
jgi:hypothetical protein